MIYDILQRCSEAWRRDHRRQLTIMSWGLISLFLGCSEGPLTPPSAQTERSFVEAFQGSWKSDCQATGPSSSQAMVFEFQFERPLSWDDERFRSKDHEIEATGTVELHQRQYDGIFCLGSGTELNASPIPLEVAVLPQTVRDGSLEFLVFQRQYDENLLTYTYQGQRFAAALSTTTSFSTPTLTLHTLADFRRAHGETRESPFADIRTMAFEPLSRQAPGVEALETPELVAFLENQRCRERSPILYTAEATVKTVAGETLNLQIVMGSRRSQESKKGHSPKAPSPPGPLLFARLTGDGRHTIHQVHQADWRVLNPTAIALEGGYRVEWNSDEGMLLVGNPTLGLSSTGLQTRIMDQPSLEQWLGEDALALSPLTLPCM